MKKLITSLQLSLFEGILFLLPTTLTVYLIYLIFRLVYSIFDFAVVFIPQQYRDKISLEIAVPATAFILVFILTIVIGYFVRTFLGRWMENMVDRVFNNLPLVKSVYKAFKQLINLFFRHNGTESFSRVVMIEYPHPGMWAIAFLTGKCPPKLAPTLDSDYYTVFMPTTPNPTTGFLLILPQESIRDTSLSIDEAIKMILSGGIIKE